MFDLSSLRTGALRRVHAKHGDYLVVAGDSVGIGALLSYYGEFCEREIALMCALTRPGECVVEVGANIGTHTIPLAKHLTPRGRLVAFEAQPVIAVLLEANLALNAIDWVDVRVAAAGRARGFAPVPLIDYPSAENVGALSLVGAQSEAQIPVETIDDLAIDRPISLIKIDVEGMELDVLKGAANTINKHRPILYVENNPYPREESINVLRFLQELSYELFWDVQSLHRPENFRGQSSPFFSNGYSSNVLAMPDRRSVNVDMFELESINNIDDHKLARILSSLGQ